MQENVKITLSHEGRIYFGPGAEELFALIRETGSVRNASEHMGMSYSKAWKLIKQAEEILGKEMVSRTKGGEGGGSASLTEDGEHLLSFYAGYDEQVKEYASSLFRRYLDEKW